MAVPSARSEYPVAGTAARTTVSGESAGEHTTSWDGASTTPERDGGEQSPRRSHRRTAWWAVSIPKCGQIPLLVDIATLRGQQPRPPSAGHRIHRWQGHGRRARRPRCRHRTEVTATNPHHIPPSNPDTRRPWSRSCPWAPPRPGTITAMPTANPPRHPTQITSGNAAPNHQRSRRATALGRAGRAPWSPAWSKVAGRPSPTMARVERKPARLLRRPGRRRQDVGCEAAALHEAAQHVRVSRIHLDRSHQTRLRLNLPVSKRSTRWRACSTSCLTL